MNDVSIDVKVCKGCGICVAFCPADVLKLSDERNERGHNVASVVALEDCIGCELCQDNCPDLAIYVRKDE